MPASGGIPSASASADAHTSPPAASTSSARYRSPTRCGGGASPESSPTPRLGQERDVRAAREPPGRLRRIPGVGVLGKQDEEPAPELLVERREQERQHGLRHAGPGR